MAGVVLMDSNFIKLIQNKVPMFNTGNEDKDLRSLGLDSLGTIELLLDLEQHYNISFSDDLLVLNENISAINLWNIINNIKKEY